jgi:2-polyprenyl-3-methyl-5-hydroxy-6-metoxy-1,4-benzoquinol methylase
MIKSKDSIVQNRKCCPVCESQDFSIFFSSKHDEPGFLDFINYEKYYGAVFYENYNNGLLKDLVFNVAECNKCHFVFLTEVFNNTGMALLYNEWLDKELLREHYNNLPYSDYEETLLNVIKKRFGKKDKIKVMDFGAGYGNFCSIATKLKLETYAYDLSDDKNDHMNSMGVTIIGNFEKYQSFFDFIWVNQVFEHLANPGEVLKNLQACLNPNGYIFIAVPDCKEVKNIFKAEGLSHSFFRNVSPHQHINAFSNSTLKLLGINAGLKPLNATDFLSFYNTNLNLNELKFLIKKTIKNSSFSTGLFFKKA